MKIHVWRKLVSQAMQLVLKCLIFGAAYFNLLRKCLLIPITCDVCRPQFSDRQYNGCGCSLSRSNALLPGQVMLSRMANKLYAFWNWDFYMNLWQERRGEERKGEKRRGERQIRGNWCPLTGHNAIISAGAPLPHIACCLKSFESKGKQFLNHIVNFPWWLTHASQAPWELSITHRPILTEGSVMQRALLTALYPHATSRK